MDYSIIMNFSLQPIITIGPQQNILLWQVKIWPAHFPTDLKDNATLKKLIHGLNVNCTCKKAKCSTIICLLLPGEL